MRRMVGFVIGIFIGALVGSTVALLLAPESGNELRGRLRARGEGLLAEVREAADARRAELTDERAIGIELHHTSRFDNIHRAVPCLGIHGQRNRFLERLIQTGHGEILFCAAKEFADAAIGQIIRGEAAFEDAEAPRHQKGPGSADVSLEAALHELQMVGLQKQPLRPMDVVCHSPGLAADAFQQFLRGLDHFLLNLALQHLFRAILAAPILPARRLRLFPG